MKNKIFLVLLISTIMYSCKPKSKLTKDVVAQHIDTTINPADDFFKYAVGHWIKSNPIPAAYSSWGIGNLVQEDVRKKLLLISENASKKNAKKGSFDQKIGDFFASAMDTNTIEKLGLQPLEAELKKIQNINNADALLEELAYLNTIGVACFFDVDIYQDQMNSEQYAVYFSQGGIGLPNRDYYFNTDKQSIRTRTYFKDTFLFEILSELPTNNTLKNTNAIYTLEEKLAKNSRKLEDLRDPYKNYNKMSVAQLTALCPAINWKKYLQKIGVQNIDSVVIGQPEFFKTLNNILKEENYTPIQNYLTYNLIANYAPYLDKKYSTVAFNFYDKIINGKKEPLPRWKRVLNWEEEVMGELLGQLYVKENFTDKTKKRYTDLVENIRNAYKERILKLDWMTDETKQNAIKKLEKVTKKVGYPDNWKDFSTLQINRNSLVENIQNSQLWWHQYSINKIGKKVDRTEWDMTPQTYNAYYNPSNNEIVLPAGIFVIPGIKDEDIDDAVVYGYAAASTIGHEITHGFDDEGRQYDEKGNLKTWWKPTDEKQFLEKTKKYIDQFNNYVVLDNLHINGEATLGENIADLGGIVLGIDAFKKTKQYKENKKIAGLTPMQRYFLGYALGWMYHQRDEDLADQIMTDVHSPAFLRVNAPFSNIPEFYEAFNVKENNKMFRKPIERVKIW